MKKLFILTLWISCFTQVHAVYVSEIMYDPEGADTSREWIEIYNDTSSAINFTSWKFFENGTNHGITSYSGGTNLDAGGYAIIADNPVKFLEDNPSYNGVLYDSTFLLSNTGEHLSLKESSSGLEINSVDYVISLGGNNDGSTLSKIEGSWVRGTVTPGKINQSSPLSSDILVTSTTTDTQGTVAQMSAPLADIVFYMPSEKIVIAGAESIFSIFGLTRSGKNIDNLNYIWAYGDGGQGTGSTTVYRYTYPGKYIIQVEGTNGYVVGTGRMSVRVVSPDISITKIGGGKYGSYIDILNPNNYDLDFSQWKLSIDGAIFPFPKNTLIAGSSVTHISGLAMGFASTTIATSSVIKILFPNMEEVTKYNLQEEIIKLSTSTQILKQIALTTFINNYPKIKQQPRVLGISTSSIKKASGTPIVISSHKETVKDTRIVAFFKSIFSH